MRPEGPRREVAAAPGETARSAAGGDRAFVPRPRLDRRLDEARSRRLIAVIGGPGSGKSSLLRRWVAGQTHAWHTVAPTNVGLAPLVGSLISAIEAAVAQPGELAGALEAAAATSGLDDTSERADAMAGFLCGVLDVKLDDDLLLVIDDLHELDPGGVGTRLVAGICRNAPARLHLVLSSREELPFPIERLAANGEVAQFDAAELAFTGPEIAELLEASAVPATDGLADAIRNATNGWPAAVRLAVEALRAHPEGGAATIETLARPGGALFGYLANEVFARGSTGLRSLIRTVAPLDRFTVALCAALGVSDADQTIRWLGARGLFVQRAGDELVLHDLVREFALEAWPLEPHERDRILTEAAMWHAANGQPETAMGLAVRAKAWPALRALVVEAGPALLHAGRARAVVDAAEQVPEPERDAALARIAGEAYAVIGMTDRAVHWLELAAPAGQPIPPDIAWRLAMSHYLRDELQSVLAVSEAADAEAAAPADAAHLAAWTAAAHRRLGNTAEAGALAERALAAANESRDDAALAAAHTAAGFAAEIAGDGVAVVRHQQLALAAARRAGDLLQIVRLEVNTASGNAETGDYQAAADALDRALEVATLAGLTTFRALALMNRGLANWCLGRLETASADYEASIEAYRQSGSHELAYALIGRGDVYRERGDLELARLSYDAGLTLAERAGDLQGLVPGLYQSAKVLALEDPAQALARAERAVAYGWPDKAWALVALGWIVWLQGDQARAHRLALDAVEVARAGADRHATAEALELRTMSADDPGREREHLVQAGRIWQDLGNPLRGATVELALARLDRGPSARATADAAERRLEQLGTRPSAFGPAGLLTAVARRAQEAVEIRTLGGFRVLRDGAPIALAEWQSKKARDLLKVLIARRGRPVPREILADALWPDDEGDASGNRLSVATSLLRQVLDPAKRFSPDHFVTTDKENVSLNLDVVAVDVEAFLADAEAGFELLRRGDVAAAIDRLAAAEAAYGGDFLEEHPYDEWAVGLREEARATYLAAVGALADQARDAGDPEREIRLRLRSLERDAYDESASLALVRAHLRRGAQGEARAAYRRYVAKMDEIDVEAVPFPSVA